MWLSLFKIFKVIFINSLCNLISLSHCALNIPYCSKNRIVSLQRAFLFFLFTLIIHFLPKYPVWLPKCVSVLGCEWDNCTVPFLLLSFTLSFTRLYFSRLRQDKDLPVVSNTHKVSFPSGSLRKWDTGASSVCWEALLVLISLFQCHGHVDQCVLYMWLDMWCSGSPYPTCDALQSRNIVGKLRIYTFVVCSVFISKKAFKVLWMLFRLLYMSRWKYWFWCFNKPP